MGGNNRGGSRKTQQKKKKKPPTTDPRKEQAVEEEDSEDDARFTITADGRREQTTDQQVMEQNGRDLEASATPFYILYTDGKWVELIDMLKCEARLNMKIRSLDDNEDGVLEVQAASEYDSKGLKRVLEKYIVPAPVKPPPKKRNRKGTTVKALLTGLPWLVNEDMVRTGLERTGFDDVAIRLHNRTNKRKPPMYILAVNTPRTSWRIEPEDIFQVDELLGIQVKMQPLPPELDRKPQCFRCQEIGHVAKHCRNPEVCVKCAGKHASRTCAISQKDQPTCSHCGGPHVASWRGCKILAGRDNERKNQQKTPQDPGGDHGKNKRRIRRRRRKRPAAQNLDQQEKRPAEERPPARKEAPLASDRDDEGTQPCGEGHDQQNIEEAIREAEARFRAVLHAEMEAACLTLREAYCHRRPAVVSCEVQTTTRACTTSGTQTPQHTDEHQEIPKDGASKTKKKKKSASCATQTSNTERDASRNRRTETKNESTQTVIETRTVETQKTTKKSLVEAASQTNPPKKFRTWKQKMQDAWERHGRPDDIRNFRWQVMEGSIDIEVENEEATS